MVPCIANNITNVSYWVHVRWFLLACSATVGTWELVLVSKPLCVSTLTSLWLFYSLSVSWEAFRNLASVFLSSILTSYAEWWLQISLGMCCSLGILSIFPSTSFAMVFLLQHAVIWKLNSHVCSHKENISVTEESNCRISYNYVLFLKRKRRKLDRLDSASVLTCGNQ